MTKSPVDTNEASSVLHEHLKRYRERPYPELRELLGRVEHADVAGPSGMVYRIDVHAIWSDREDADLWVMAMIEDPDRPASRPLADSFVMRPDGTLASG